MVGYLHFHRFPPHFLGWATEAVGFPVRALPTFETLESLKDLVAKYANRLAAQQWKLKTGKSWFHVVHHHVFSVGDSLCNGDLMVKIHKVIPFMSTNFSPEGKRHISAKISPLVTPMCGPPTFSPSGHNSGVVTIPQLLIKSICPFWKFFLKPLKSTLVPSLSNIGIML